jgi:predicted nucleotidyltransferase
LAITYLQGIHGGDAMNNKELSALIRELLPGIGIKDIILFGSRARGEGIETSDYDILIILRNDLPRTERLRLTARVRSELAKRDIDGDILVRSLSDVDYLKDKIGSVTRNAVKEGIHI